MFSGKRRKNNPQSPGNACHAGRPVEPDCPRGNNCDDFSRPRKIYRDNSLRAPTFSGGCRGSFCVGAGNHRKFYHHEERLAPRGDSASPARVNRRPTGAQVLGAAFVRTKTSTSKESTVSPLGHALASATMWNPWNPHARFELARNDNLFYRGTPFARFDSHSVCFKSEGQVRVRAVVGVLNPVGKLLRSGGASFSFFA